MDIIIQTLSFISVIQAMTFLVLALILITVMCLFMRICRYLATSDEKTKKADNEPTDHSKVENEILDAVEEAWNECYFGVEFKERLDELRKKYTKSEDSGDE